jgi:digeranylgeranylglycerophospholipid reductase
MVCAQYLLAGIEIDPACTCYTIDHRIAPGGYAWIFPKGEGPANVGLGVQADLWEDAANAHVAQDPVEVGTGNVLGFLTRFIESHPTLSQGYPVTLVTGNVPVATPPAPMVTGGLMLVGDAARQVDPLTGGGITNAMHAGRLAARVTVEALEVNDSSAAFLSRYEEAWRRTIGRKMERNYRLRERFPPAERADERFVRAFALAAGGG